MCGLRYARFLVCCLGYWSLENWRMSYRFPSFGVYVGVVVFGERASFSNQKPPMQIQCGSSIYLLGQRDLPWHRGDDGLIHRISFLVSPTSLGWESSKPTR